MCLAPVCLCKIQNLASLSSLKLLFVESTKQKMRNEPRARARFEIRYLSRQPAPSELPQATRMMAVILPIDNCQPCDDALFIVGNGGTRNG